MNKFLGTCLSIFILLSLAACSPKSTCPVQNDSSRYLSPQEIKPQSSLPPENSSLPAKVMIGGKLRTVDKVVTGPLCNDHWTGTVYVTCDVQVFAWEEKPLFLKDCDLSMEPNTVVYVADHNDAAYYNGCSCHTGEQP